MNQEKYKIESGKLLSATSNHETALPAKGDPRDFRIFAPENPGAPPEDGESVTILFIGLRKVSQVRLNPDGTGYGYAFISGSQCRINLQTVSIMGESDIIGIVEMGGNSFQSPRPLHTQEHARQWNKAGFDAKLPANKWRKLLRWNGAGSKQAAAIMRDRWAYLMQGLKVPADVPGVHFPPMERDAPPLVDDAPDWRGEMERRITETREAMERRIMELENRIAALEFIP